MSKVTVEMYGVVRRRAGRSSVVVHAATAAAALREAAAICPGLAGVLRDDGGLASHYLISNNGERFLADLTEPLADGDRLLLLSADAGG